MDNNTFTWPASTEQADQATISRASTSGTSGSSSGSSVSSRLGSLRSGGGSQSSGAEDVSGALGLGLGLELARWEKLQALYRQAPEPLQLPPLQPRPPMYTTRSFNASSAGLMANRRRLREQPAADQRLTGPQ